MLFTNAENRPETKLQAHTHLVTIQNNTGVYTEHSFVRRLDDLHKLQ